MANQNLNNKKGFTIIEVVLVLGIAGLIFLMVFIALPALQRNRRDTQRTSDISRLASALTNYQSNNSGAIPSDKFGSYVSGHTEVDQNISRTLKHQSWAYFYDSYLIIGKEDKDKYLYAKLKKGYLHFRTKDFKPENEFYLTLITSLDANYYFPEKTEKGFKLRDNFSDAGVAGTNLEYYLEHDLKNITDDELRIIRNYPYATAGYDFPDKKLKDYFSKFLWYIPIGKNVTLENYEYEWIKKADKIIDSRKK